MIVCMTWLLQILGALTAPTSMALTCRWRSRPQHQQRTLDEPENPPRSVIGNVTHSVFGVTKIQYPQTSTTGTTGKLAGFSNELFEHNKIELEL